MKYSIAHIGDIHASEKRLDEAVECLSFALNTAGQRQVNLIVIGGDIWDGSVVNIEGSALLPIVDCFSRFCNAYNIPIVMIYGTPSHDVPGSLEIFNNIDNNIVVSSVTNVVNIHPFSVITFPYSRSVGTAPKEKIMERLMNLSANAQNPIRIFLAHMGLQDVREAAYSDIRMPDFSSEDLIPLGCHYYAMNHIHNGEIPQLTGNIRYSGSLYHVDYGDVSPKGFYIVEFEETDLGEPLLQYKFVGVERICTPSTPIINLKGEELASADVKGKRVKVKLRIDPDEAGQDEEQLRQELLDRGAVEVKIDRILMPRSEIRQSLSGAETLADKIKIWCEVVNRKWSDNLIEKCQEVEAYG